MLARKPQQRQGVLHRTGIPRTPCARHAWDTQHAVRVRFSTLYNKQEYKTSVFLRVILPLLSIMALYNVLGQSARSSSKAWLMLGARSR